MAYLKPKPFVKRVFNPLAMRFGIGGAQTLVVRRRQSGAEQRIPVIPVEHGGSRHIVSTRGESDWVRNVRAAGVCEIEGGSAAGRFRAVEVPLGQTAEVIARYREVAGRTVKPYWEQLPEDKDHPVFRIEPA